MTDTQEFARTAINEGATDEWWATSSEDEVVLVVGNRAWRITATEVELSPRTPSAWMDADPPVPHPYGGLPA